MRVVVQRARHDWVMAGPGLAHAGQGRVRSLDPFQPRCLTDRFHLGPLFNSGP